MRCKLVTICSNADSWSVPLKGDTVSPTSPNKHFCFYHPNKWLPCKMWHILLACRRWLDAIHGNENPGPWGDTSYACMLNKCVCTSCKTIPPLPSHPNYTHKHTAWMNHLITQVSWKDAASEWVQFSQVLVWNGGSQGGPDRVSLIINQHYIYFQE